MMSVPPSTAILPDAPSSDNPLRPNHHLTRKERFPRACTSRSAARLYSASAPAPAADRRSSASTAKDEQLQQCSKIVTPLAREPLPSEVPQWNLRSMWELASLLHFLHIFRPFLNIGIEFTAEELESALITPNGILDDIHMPLLRAIPPITRMALGRGTWVTVLCRKLRDWWHWVADGEIPIVAAHGAEIETYKMLDPGTRVRILKALCDIRVEQEDIRSYIDDSVKRGVPLSAFRKERIGGDSHGTSYWYEDDPVIGHRLYREIRKIEVKKVKARGAQLLPIISCQWETVATNLDEFQDVSEKLVSSKNRIEAALGKRLKNDVLPEIEKIHKRKEKLMKKQHREALLLDSFLTADGLASGRSLRDRKPVTYTFDDYDRSINEAIKITKKRQVSPEPAVRREVVVKPEASSNGRWNGSSIAEWVPTDTPSPKSTDYEETDGEHKAEHLDRTNRRRRKPRRYSEKEFVEAISDNEADFNSDDDIVGEAVYDDEYLRSRKQRKVSSSSEGDEEYRWEEENAEDEDEEEDDSFSVSEDIEEPQRSKKLPSRRREMKLRSVDEIQSGLRRSKRATRNRIDYRQYEMSDSEGGSAKAGESNASDRHSDASNNMEDSMESQDSQDDEDDEELKNHQQMNDYVETVDKEQGQVLEKANSPSQEAEGVKKRRFLDLNELAPVTGFDDGPSTTIEGEDAD